MSSSVFLERKCEIQKIEFYGEKYERCIGYHIAPGTNTIVKDPVTTTPATATANPVTATTNPATVITPPAITSATSTLRPQAATVDSSTATLTATHATSPTKPITEKSQPESEPAQNTAGNTDDCSSGTTAKPPSVISILMAVFCVMFISRDLKR